MLKTKEYIKNTVISMSMLIILGELNFYEPALTVRMRAPTLSSPMRLYYFSSNLSKPNIELIFISE